MVQMENSLQAIKFSREDVSLSILDQLLLPHRVHYRSITSIDDAHDAIKLMMVRGGLFKSVLELYSDYLDFSSRYRDCSYAGISGGLTA